jgi:penicillin-insensitive murein endopeptidase
MTLPMRLACSLTFLGATALAGCANAPSPLAPGRHGSIGRPNSGVLTDGIEVRRDAEGLRWLRGNDRHWALPRFSAAIQRAAAAVARRRPGAALLVGDLSTRTGGGPLSPHFSHRSGVDADLLLYLSTAEGAPVDAPGFVHVGADGLARDEAHHRWLRFDVDREWLLLKALLEDPQARVQWLFVSDVVQAMILEWALARGDSLETIRRAREVMAQPNPGGVHDDHVHVRTACSPEETVDGCESVGPRRTWLAYDLQSFATADTGVATDDDELVLALFRPLDTEQAPIATGSCLERPADPPAPSHGKSTP